MSQNPEDAKRTKDRFNAPSVPFTNPEPPSTTPQTPPQATPQPTGRFGSPGAFSPAPAASLFVPPSPANSSPPPLPGSSSFEPPGRPNEQPVLPCRNEMPISPPTLYRGQNRSRLVVSVVAVVAVIGLCVAVPRMLNRKDNGTNPSAPTPAAQNPSSGATSPSGTPNPLPVAQNPVPPAPTPEQIAAQQKNERAAAQRKAALTAMLQSKEWASNLSVSGGEKYKQFDTVTDPQARLIAIQKRIDAELQALEGKLGALALNDCSPDFQRIFLKHRQALQSMQESMDGAFDLARRNTGTAAGLSLLLRSGLDYLKGKPGETANKISAEAEAAGKRIQDAKDTLDATYKEAQTIDLNDGLAARRN